MQNLLIKRVCVLIASLYLLGFGSVASAQEYKFAYSIPYKPALFSKKPKPEDLQAAIDNAASEVWSQFLLSVPQAELIQYDEPSNKQKIEARFDELVTISAGPQVRVDEKKKIIQVGGRGIVNVTLLRVIVGGDTRSNPVTSEIAIGFLVLPRLQQSVTSFDAEREKVTSSTGRQMSENVLSEEVSGSASGVTERTVEGAKTATESVERTSGSSTRVSQEAEYRVGNVVQVTGALSEAFNNAGFDAYDYSDIAANCGGPSSDVVMSAILERASGDLPGAMRKGVFDATRDDGCLAGEFFVLGTIDIDSIELKQGIVHASAIVNVQIFDLSRRIPKRVASIDSVRRDGEGTTEDKAVSNAISKATGLAGAEIVSAFANRL
ncbi:hypothetical protein GH975_06230 [Litorivicinus lipolyticus]|uniref:Curli production assembly/transport component CsgG n=1 Tax=Litorivicinus lipolyticus TaxID=418701 RepID=A0A5Q2QAC6_9GAMM|nr:hypothetical protein [Litorivicinus lipolyticus]QGG80193.1 hypothetical protein GH975_06230 [Litorivicinus lipolyticus]